MACTMSTVVEWCNTNVMIDWLIHSFIHWLLISVRYEDGKFLPCLLFWEEVTEYGQAEDRSADRLLRLCQAWNIYNRYLAGDSPLLVEGELLTQQNRTDLQWFLLFYNPLLWNLSWNTTGMWHSITYLDPCGALILPLVKSEDNFVL